MVRQLSSVCVMSGILLLARPAGAEQLQITIENVQTEGGFFFTPVWLGFHDGTFDLFDMGSLASSQLSTLAETGDTDPLMALFGGSSIGYDTTVAAPAGFAVPVFEPMETVNKTLDVPNPSSNRYLSFASMVIPSNDAFFGNGDPMAYPVFNADGSFAGPLVIEITGNRIYDAGSEVNDAMGAAFSALGGTDTDEAINIALHAGLDNFVNTETASGATITSAIGPDEVLARITINAIPEPATMGLYGLGWATFACLFFRRRKNG